MWFRIGRNSRTPRGQQKSRLTQSMRQADSLCALPVLVVRARNNRSGFRSWARVRGELGWWGCIRKRSTSVSAFLDLRKQNSRQRLCQWKENQSSLASCVFEDVLKTFIPIVTNVYAVAVATGSVLQ